MRRPLLALCLLALGCQGSPAPTPGIEALKPAASAPDTLPLSREAEQARLAVRALSAVELDAIDAHERACDDAALSAAATTSDARVVTVRVADARYDSKSLLPLSITEPLSLPNLAELDGAISGVSGPEASARAREIAEGVRTRRFIAVAHITRFAMPRWIWRLGHKKPEWVAGHLEAWIAIHDAQSGERSCQTRVWVVNDTKDAPLRRRLRGDTRDRLVDALAEALVAELPKAIRRLTGVLSLPESGKLALSQP
ncbi:MAG: hypothetical protein R3B13_31215 [Polyangiaceae bacterium]